MGGKKDGLDKTPPIDNMRVNTLTDEIVGPMVGQTMNETTNDTTDSP